MDKPKLTTTQQEFEALHELLDGSKAKNIEVPKTILNHLLLDHSAMYAALNPSAVVITPVRKPDAPIKRKRLKKKSP